MNCPMLHIAFLWLCVIILFHCLLLPVCVHEYTLDAQSITINKNGVFCILNVQTYGGGSGIVGSSSSLLEIECLLRALTGL